MLDFKPVGLDLRRRCEPILRQGDDRGCEYTFGNIYIWRDSYDTRCAFTEDGNLIIRFDSRARAYLFPCGDGDIRSSVEQMMEDSARRGRPFRIIAATRQDVQRLQQLFPERLLSHTNRDFAEYVYRSEDLIGLSGKGYHGKRNHIARFVDRYPDYRFEPFSADNIGEARQMSESWYREALPSEPDESLYQEKTAVDNAFDHFFDLGFSGGLIRAGGDVVAFAIGEPISDSTFCVHIEKAFPGITGAYSVINRDFAAHFCLPYAFVNREDDVGQPGLRRSKLSYRPAVLTDKFIVTCAQDPFREEHET